MAVLFTAKSNPAMSHWGLLVLRAVVGIVFVAHGWQKLTDIGIDGVGTFLGSVGIPAPGLMAVVLTIVEIVGGLALIVGFGTRTAAAVLALVMAIAIASVHGGNGFFARPDNGYEFALTLLAACICLALAGGGALAADAKLSNNR